MAATKPITKSKLNSLEIVSLRDFAPCGLWAASIITVGFRCTTSQRPGDVAPAKADLTSSPSSACSPTNTSTAASAVAALLA